MTPSNVYFCRKEIYNIYFTTAAHGAKASYRYYSLRYPTPTDNIVRWLEKRRFIDCPQLTIIIP